MSKVFAYLDHIFRMVRPRRLLYMAIDGVAPRAKMNQQRSRRFRSALEAEKLRAEAAAKGEPEAKGEPFDSNCITPGTPFMARLSDHLRFYVKKKQTEDPLWAKATVILSGHEVRGEGEHKIMEHIRWARGEPGWDPNQTHCLYGLDADLIMLALVTHEPHFCLLREVVKFGGGERGQPSREVLSNPTDDGFLLLHVGLLREYLDQEFKTVADRLPFEYDCERIVDDFVLLSMLVGNDFLPPLPTLDIAEGALNKLFSTYRELLPTLGGYVTGDDGGGTFDPKRLEKILVVVGELEADVLAERSRDAQANEERQARKNGGGNGGGGRGGRKAVGGNKKPAPASGGDSSGDAAFQKAMLALMHGAGAGADASAAAASSSSPDASDPSAASSGISADPTMMSASKRAMFEEGGAGIEGWKEMYYREKLGLKIGEAPPLAELRQAYFEGLNWVLRYYYRGVASWTWYYPFHYAPMASDLAKGLGDLTVAFDYGRPFRPFEQLLAVQPPQSAALLPEPFRWLMTAPHSPLAPFFPSELKVDFEGKRNDWEGVVLLPFLDEALLKQCIASVPRDKLSAAQIQRNEPGPLVVFQHAPAGAGDAPSTLPKVFPGLFPCKSKAFESMPPGEFPTNRACFGGRGCLLPGVKLGVDRPPGFPTMTSLEARGELKHAGVNVFGTASKKESLILRVGRGGDPGLLTDSDSADDSTRAAAFAHLLGRRVFISWPYLKESVVVAVSDKSEKIVGKGAGRQSHSSAEWGAEAQRAANALMQTKGVDVGQTAVQLHCRQCEGLVRHPDGSLQKRFGKTDVMVPAHLALASDPSPSPRLKERGPTINNATSGGADSSADPNADASSGDSGGFRAGDAALYLGRSHFGAIATVAGFVPGRGLECFVQPAAPDTGVGRRVLQASSAAGRFEPAGAVARKLGLHPRALSALTGPLWIAPTKDCGRFDRVDVGLNLKSAAKGLCVSGFTRPGKDGAGWDYGQGAIQLMQEYKRAHGWVFAALQSDPDGGFEGLELDVALKHVPEAARLPALKALKAWLKAAPSAKKPLVSKFSKIAPDAAIKALHAAVGGQSVRDARDAKLEPVSLEGVSPLLLMRPVTQGEVMDLYAGGDFELGDRVAMVGDGGSPPFGTRGFVVATHGEAAEVMFDARDFVGATDLHGVLPEKRGAMLPVAQLVNLSHPPAMPQLGDAAPATRARDKKGKVTKGGWDGKDGKGGGKGVLAMAAALLPGRAPAVGGPGAGGLLQGTAAAGPKMPDGGRGFAGAGRGRGAAANGTGGAARTLGKPLPGAIVGSVVSSNKPAAAAAAAAPDLGSMLAGAQLKSILGVGRGAEARDESQSRGGGGTRANGAAEVNSANAAALSLEDLERRFADSTSVAPSPKPRGGANAPATPPIKGPAPPGPPPGADDPAAFWTALAGGGAPKPTNADRPTPAKVTMPPRARTEARDAPTSLADLEAKIKPAAGAAAPAGGGGGITLADLEARVRAPVEASAGSDDPLAFWAELQARHKSELDAIVGFAPDGNGPGPGPGEKKKSRSRGGKNR